MKDKKTWLKETYRVIDARELDGFIDRLDDEVWIRFGNAAPVSGVANAREAFAEFFDSISGMSHDIKQIWSDSGSDTYGVEATIAYTRKADGQVVHVPSFTAWKLEGDDTTIKGRHVQIFIDISPVFQDQPLPSLCDGESLDPVEQAGKESFPASDPPSFTGTTS